MSDATRSELQTFPPGFLWGAAAASYQIEGAVEEEGKGPSVWDMFCARPGAVWQGDSGKVACDHYHRYREDVGLMQQVGLKAYRLSLCWPRILPAGTGQLNQRGLDFYSRLVDALLEANIAPWVTLFHWDYPLELHHRGGWLNRDSADWFAEYADVVARHLSDRVRHFITLNEPQVYIGLGHLEAKHAPGHALPLSQVLLAGHHTLLAHGKAVQALRAGTKQPLEIGVAPVGMPRHPASGDAADVEAARRASFVVAEKNTWNNAWWMDPMLLGRYPEQGLEFYGADAPKVTSEDLQTICQRLDFLGVNIYQSAPVRASSEAPWGFEQVDFPPGFPRTAFNWPITPEALYWGPRFLYERYRQPIIITENGLSCRDVVALDGHVHDHARIDFTQRHLLQLHRAIADGVDVRGYFHWSILDNFEWAAGYRERFGLIHVDYQTQARVLKDSAFWYRGVIESNGKSLFGEGNAS